MAIVKRPAGVACAPDNILAMHVVGFGEKRVAAGGVKLQASYRAVGKGEDVALTPSAAPAVTTAVVGGSRYRGVALADRVADRRARLIEAGTQLFGTRGYHATTVRQICAAAGLTERYFYESFPNSEALLLACYAELVERQASRIEHAVRASDGSADGAMRALLTAFLSDAEKSPAVMRLTLIEPRTVSAAGDAAFRATQRRLAQLLLGVMTAGGLVPPPGYSAELLSRALGGALYALVLAWFEAGFDRPLDEMIRTCLAVYTAMAAGWHRAAAAA